MKLIDNINNLLFKLVVLPWQCFWVYRNWFQYMRYYFGNQKKDFTFELRNGVKIFARKDTNDRQIINEICMQNSYHIKRLDLNSKFTIIDIGANIGTFSLLCYGYSNCKLIYCYEPETENFKTLQYNIDLNGATNIKAYLNAVTSTRGKRTLFLDDNNKGYHNLYRPTAKSVSIDSITLYDVFYDNGIQFCDLLKMDCEGSEFEILNNISHDLFRKIGLLIFEVHESLGGYKIGNLLNLLKANNFEVETHKTRGGDIIIFASNSESREDTISC